ncbi:unnamed protein product [Ilex paraguariensis]|uniref:Uncharacterized protein n=1 Tax=Ilex paraguariensis TaxID=185542 RepID=A0ABC8THA1_9AQUA
MGWDKFVVELHRGGKFTWTPKIVYKGGTKSIDDATSIDGPASNVVAASSANGQASTVAALTALAANVAASSPDGQASTTAPSTDGQALTAAAACTVGCRSGAVGRCSGSRAVNKYIQLVQPARNVQQTNLYIQLIG